MEEKLCIYELVKKIDETNPKKMSYEFVMKHQLDTNNSFMFRHMSSKDVNVDPMAYMRNNPSQIKIDNKGIVKICFVENLPIANNLDLDS
jgi:hypothetical protein